MRYLAIFNMWTAWNEQRQKYEAGEITKEEYDQWRYRYPEGAAKNFKKLK